MLEVRSAIAADYDPYAALFGQLGTDDPIPSRERFVGELARRTLIATVDGNVVGYALIERLSDVGYVRNLVTDHAARRRGIGRALMAAARADFVAGGATAWCLNVRYDNLAAIRLYDGCGLAIAYRTTVLRLAATVPLADCRLTVATIAPADDRELEVRFGLLGGQLASARAKHARALLRFDDADRAVGVAVFVRAIPGASPFRAVSGDLAVAMVAALRARLPTAPFMQVVVENDDEVARHLVAAGAHITLNLFHMRGQL